MQKIAIFCEGQTELIILRELILRKYEYCVNIECRTLFTNHSLNNVPYDCTNPGATKLFSIINVGNDNAVLARLLFREPRLLAEGYEKIIAVRDMYSKDYRESSLVIDDDIINKFKAGISNTIQKRAKEPDKIYFCHAIMETESWFLGLPHNFIHLDATLTAEYINERLNVDLNTVDPEKEIYHPAKLMDDIYNLVGNSYDKSRDDIEAIASRTGLSDYEGLYLHDKCNSFNMVYDNL